MFNLRFSPARSRFLSGSFLASLLIAGCSSENRADRQSTTPALSPTKLAANSEPVSHKVVEVRQPHVLLAAATSDSSTEVRHPNPEVKPAAQALKSSASASIEKIDPVSPPSKDSSLQLVSDSETPATPDSKPIRKTAQSKPAEPLLSTLIKAFAPTPDSSLILAEEPAKVTKDSYRRIKVAAETEGISLQTFCIDHEGRIIALLGASRYSNEPVKNSEIRILNPQGEDLKKWKLSFPAQSVNVGPDRMIYVAGDGKIASYDNDGKEHQFVNLPHIEELIGDQDKVRQNVEELLKKQQDSNNRNILSLEKQLARLKNEKTPGEPNSQKSRIVQLEAQITSMRQMLEKRSETKLNEMVQGQLKRLKIINSIAVSDQYVFLVCGDSKGYGYNLWRTDLAFQNAKLVIENLRGCCGQMDVQIAGNEIVVAQNTEHKFGRYDVDGKLVGKFGKQGRGTDPACFGGCCNPMNVRAASNGDIFTAESEGIIKRFSAAGEFKSEVGKCALTGGCKNVALDVAPDNRFVYFCDQPGSQIVVLDLPATEVVGKN